jgi:hypothetical protein
VLNHDNTKISPANITCSVVGTTQEFGDNLLMCKEDPQEAKYANMIPIYTAPVKVQAQSPRIDLGAISEM